MPVLRKFFIRIRMCTFLGIPSTSANLGKNFGGIILDPREGRGDNLLSDLEGGHFHSGFIYTLYNTGIIGCLLLLFIFLQVFLD